MTELTAGQALPPKTYLPTSRQTVQYAVVSGELSEIHYDPVSYRSLGVERPLIHGGLKAAWVVQSAIEWAGGDAVVKELDLTYRGMDLVDDEYVIEGSVTSVETTPTGTVVECQVRGSAKGSEKLTTQGKIVVELSLNATRY